MFVSEGQSQFAGLELSESQGPGAGGRDSQQQDKEAVLSQTEQERHSQQGGPALYARFHTKRAALIAAYMNVNRHVLITLGEMRLSVVYLPCT